MNPGEALACQPDEVHIERQLEDVSARVDLTSRHANQLAGSARCQHLNSDHVAYDDRCVLNCCLKVVIGNCRDRLGFGCSRASTLQRRNGGNRVENGRGHEIVGHAPLKHSPDSSDLLIDARPRAAPHSHPISELDQECRPELVDLHAAECRDQRTDCKFEVFGLVTREIVITGVFEIAIGKFADRVVGPFA